jgi:hypothetical protein
MNSTACLRENDDLPFCKYARSFHLPAFADVGPGSLNLYYLRKENYRTVGPSSTRTKWMAPAKWPNAMVHPWQEYSYFNPSVCRLHPDAESLPRTPRSHIITLQLYILFNCICCPNYKLTLVLVHKSHIGPLQLFLAGPELERRSCHICAPYHRSLLLSW